MLMTILYSRLFLFRRKFLNVILQSIPQFLHLLLNFIQFSFHPILIFLSELVGHVELISESRIALKKFLGVPKSIFNVEIDDFLLHFGVQRFAFDHSDGFWSVYSAILTRCLDWQLDISAQSALYCDIVMPLLEKLPALFRSKAFLFTDLCQ